jgi:hypothetical protein
MRKFWRGSSTRIARVNGEAALLAFGATLHSVTTIDVEDGRIRSILTVRNPEKLRHALEAVGPIV